MHATHFAPHLSLVAVCDVQELTFKVSGTFGMPGLTDGQSCLSKLTDLCIPCGVDFGWDKLLPTIACELTQPSLLSGQWTIPELTYVMDITQKDLFIKLSYLAKTAAAAPEVASMPTLTGSDIT